MDRLEAQPAALITQQQTAQYVNTHIVNSFQWHLKTHLIRAAFSGAPRGKLLRCTYDSLV